MLTTVIVGVDGRDGGRDATALARVLGSDVIVLLNAFPWETGHRSSGPIKDYGTVLRTDTLGLLEAERSHAEIDAELVAVGDISPARAIHAEAQRRNADLIIVGSAHRGRLGRVLLGSVARSTVQGAPCPVAVAPRGFSARAHAIRTVGAGYDGSPEAEAAVTVAAALSSRFEATLTVAAAWEDPSLRLAGLTGVTPYAADYTALAEDLRAQTATTLDDKVRALAHGTTGALTEGRAADVLEELSKNVDLLVLGSRGWGPARRVLLGSTSDHLVHHAACPVIVVQRPSASEADDGGEV